MIPIYELEDLLGGYADSRDLVIVVDGVEVSCFELVDGATNPELHINLNGTGL